MVSELSRRFANRSIWGLRRAPAESVRGRVVEQHWRAPTLLALAATVPAFYVELLRVGPVPLAALAYALAALVVGAALAHTAWRCGQPGRHLAANPLDLGLVSGLLLSALLPSSIDSTASLLLRLAVSLLTLVRMVWSLQHLITRGSMMYLLVVSGALLGLCGVGFWWLEPKVNDLGDGLWLAFTTAATVGFGDIVPSTPASKIFSVFVVMLGYGVLSLVTAAIAAQWVETEERIIEREILRDMHRQMNALRHEIVALREDLAGREARQPPAPGAAAPATEPAADNAATAPGGATAASAARRR